MAWTSQLGLSEALGPPVAPAPPDWDQQAWSRMHQRVRPCPQFPKNIHDKPYRMWKLEFVQWIWDMRRASVSEALLKSPFVEALKNGANGVYDSVVLIDPRVLGHPGRPAGYNGPNDPGALSGVVW